MRLKQTPGANGSVALSDFLRFNPQLKLLGSVSQSLVHRQMSGRPACDDPYASRMRPGGELASVQAIPRVFPSVLSLVDITDLTLSCEASPGNGCLAGVWCCMARLRTKWPPGRSSCE